MCKELGNIILIIIILIFFISVLQILVQGKKRNNTSNKGLKYNSVEEMVDNFENLTEDEKQYVIDFYDNPKTIGLSGKPQRYLK